MLNQLKCEIRFFIRDVDKLMDILQKLNAKPVSCYEFTDYYYKPKFESWNPENKSLRIREWRFNNENSNLPCEVLFSKRAIKNVKCAYGGKVKLFEGSFKDCKRFLEDLGFEFWFKIVKRNCKVFKVQNFSFAFEFIENLGYMGEMEIRENSLERVNKRLKKFLNVLKIPKSDVSFKTLASIYLKNLRS